jgi:hypothetical protein
METRCHWLYTHPAWGRVMTKEPFTESEARSLLPDAERVEGTEVELPVRSFGHSKPAGLVRRADGAMMQPEAQAPGRTKREP